MVSMFVCGNRQHRFERERETRLSLGALETTASMALKAEPGQHCFLGGSQRTISRSTRLVETIVEIARQILSQYAVLSRLKLSYVL